MSGATELKVPGFALATKFSFINCSHISGIALVIYASFLSKMKYIWDIWCCQVVQIFLSTFLQSLNSFPNLQFHQQQEGFFYKRDMHKIFFKYLQIADFLSQSLEKSKKSFWSSVSFRCRDWTFFCITFVASLLFFHRLLAIMVADLYICLCHVFSKKVPIFGNRFRQLKLI